MARMRTARRDAFSILAGELSSRFGVNILERYLSERVLRGLIPFLLLIFFILLVIGILAQFTHGRQVAIEDARVKLTLIADAVTANLQNTIANQADWQNRLAQSLPAGATLAGRQILLADINGKIQAAAPITARSEDRTLLQVLGADQPVTILGTRAGVVRITLTDGSDALVTVRNIPGTDAQVTLIQPLAYALKPLAKPDRSRHFPCPHVGHSIVADGRELPMAVGTRGTRGGGSVGRAHRPGCGLR